MKIIAKGLAIASMVFFSTAIGAEEPSYQQTTEFISEKLNYPLSSKIVSGRMRYFYEVRFPKKCHMELKSAYFLDDGSIQRGEKDLIDLSKYDPTSVDLKVKSNGTYVFAESTNKEYAHELEYTQKGKVSYHSRTGIAIKILDREKYGYRVEKALKHLIKICGGKGQLF